MSEEIQFEEQHQTQVAIAPEMSRAYKEATGDTNKLHDVYALGFQLELILERLARPVVTRYNPFHELVGIQTTFHLPVPVDATCTAEIKADADRAYIQAQLIHEGKVATTSELRYGFEGVRLCAPGTLCLAVPTIEARAKQHLPVQYVLTEQNARLAAQGIGKTEPDYAALALGLVSNALIQRARELQPEGGESKQPKYDQHTIIPCAGIRELTDGTSIDVYVALEPIEETVKNPLTGNRTELKRTNRYRALAYAEAEKVPVYAFLAQIKIMKEGGLQRLLDKAKRTANP
ncbi:hypothetical protein HY489_02605 [Candidatus Woesearchaeota archaeon]|nr:hypothetical protein [Candidatus Woesearchaeota archaeon]